MKVAITSVIHITGNDGREWTKVSYLKPSGEAGTALFPKGKIDTSKLVPVEVDVLDFGDEIIFGERGYVEDIN